VASRLEQIDFLSPSLPLGSPSVVLATRSALLHLLRSRDLAALLSAGRPADRGPGCPLTTSDSIHEAFAFTDAFQHGQRLAAGVMHRASWESMWVSGTHTQQLRLEAGALPGASGWLQAVPCQPRFRFDGWCFRAALRMFLMLAPIPAVSPRCAGCGAAWDGECLHFWSCRSRCRLIPHDQLLDVLSQAASAVFRAGTVRVPDLPGQRGTREWESFSPEHRPDLVILHAARRGGHLIADVTVPSFTVPSARGPAATGARAFLRVMEERKVAQYGFISPEHLVVPLVISQFGSVGPQFSRFIDELHRVAGGREADPTWSASHFRASLLQSLSVSFWRSLSRHFADLVARPRSSART
jgi:hypothetical protein